MSYSLYLQRSKPIQGDELVDLSEDADGTFRWGELVLWLQDGQLEYRGGREADLPALLQLAERLGARLVGDDGETYPLPEAGGRPGGRSLWDRAQEWLAARIPPKNSPFQVGDSVRDIISGRQGTVLAVQGGHLPKVRVRYRDGKETLRSLESSGLEKI